MPVSSLSSDVLAYSSSTTSGEITFQGLGNGTDFGEIKEATIEAEGYRKDQYEADLLEAETSVELLTTLDENLLTLSGALQEMDTVNEFYAYKETSSGDEVSVSADPGAEEGSYNLEVNQLAEKDIWIAEDVDITSKNEILCTTDSTITIAYAGEDITMDVSAGTTAEELVEKINGSSEFDDKVKATLLYDGSNYHLSLAGGDTGSSNIIEIKDLSALDTMAAADFTNTQIAQNAKMKIDGYPSDPGEWLERDLNNIDDLVEGLDITLNSTTDSDGITIGVGYDTDAMVTKVEDFVTELNQIIYDLQTITGRLDDDSDDDDEDSSFSMNDASLDLVYNQFKSILSSSGQGFDYYNSSTGEGDLFSSLSTVGISTDSEEGSATFGQLVIDYDELESALDEDAEAVAMIFSASGEAVSDTDDLEVTSTISSLTQAGEYDIQYEVAGGTIISATVDGKDMLISGNTLLAGSDSDANGLYLEVKDLSDGAHSGGITVKQGKIGELTDYCEVLTDVETGTIPLLTASYENLTTTLENEIYEEEARIDALDEELTRKYAALDETLSYYTNLESQLSTSLAQLS